MNIAERFLDWLVMDMGAWIMLAMIGVVVLGIAAIIYAAVQDSNSPHIGLLKSEWSCTKTEPRTYTQMMLVGKVMVPQIITDTVCVEYTRR